MATQMLGIPSFLSHYQIIEKVGEGGMGAVYRAHDLRLDREVAIKVLPPRALADAAARRRFRHEALALSKLNHPNIATVHDFDTDRDLDFLVMEYIPGETLSDRLTSGPLPPNEVLNIATQVLDALGAAHSRGIVHRDLKPGNLRLTPDGRIKVLDFGLAKAFRVEPTERTASLTGSLGPCGTLPYMAPEQVRGGQCDPRTDIYAAGAVLYELTTGHQLFPGMQGGNLVDAILHEQPATPKSATKDVPDGLVPIILRALNKDPDQRYQTSTEFLLDIRRITGESGTSPACKTSRQLLRLPRVLIRYRRAAILAVTCLAVVVAALTYLRTSALAFNARDFVIITDFDNQTGDPVFDKSLTTAFTTSLGQSAFANIVSRQHLIETLKRMKRAPTDKIDESLAREIGQREGLNIVIIPTIAAVADTYSIGARIHDVQKDRDFRSVAVTAKGKGEVLSGIDKLATRVRMELGESAQAITQTTKPLAQVTTSSLDALRQYSLAIEQRRSGKADEARSYLENALRIDPNFTSARSSLGALLIDMANMQIPGYDFEQGKALLDQASRNLSGLTDRERYGILAFRASRIDHEPEAAISNYKALLASYPDDISAHNNICWIYVQMGRYQEAISEARIVMRLDPTFILAQINLGFIYLYRMNDVPAALEVYNHILAIEPDNAWAHDAVGWANLARGDFPAAQRSFEKAVQSNPRQLLSRYRLAHSYRLHGDFEKAVDVLLEVRRLFPSDIAAIYDEALNREAMGQHQEAISLFRMYCDKAELEARKSKEPVTRLNIAAALARMEHKKEAAEIVKAALKAHPESAFDAALVLALLGRKDEAVDQLRSAINKGYDNFIWIKVHPDLVGLHGYPGFEQLLAGKIKT